MLAFLILGGARAPGELSCGRTGSGEDASLEVFLWAPRFVMGLASHELGQRPGQKTKRAQAGEKTAGNGAELA